MKKYLLLMVVTSWCVILFSNASVMAVTTKSTTGTSSGAVSPTADAIESSSKNQIKKIVTLFMGWKNERLITKDGEYKLDNTTKLYDFVNSKRASAGEAGKAIAELIFVDDQLKIVIIRPGKIVSPAKGGKP